MTIPWLVMTLAALPAGVESVKAYKGKDGQVVEVVRLAPRDSGKAAVRVRGSDSVADGLVLDCAVSSESGGFRFTTKREGADWNVLVQDGEKYTVFVPDRPEFKVAYDEAAATAVDAAALLSDQKAQRTDGRLWTFERKSWPRLWAKYDKKAAEASATLAKSCGRAVAVSVAWHTFPDDVMADLDAWKLCEPVVAHLQKRCSKAERFDAVTCALGDQFALTKDAASLRFVTTRGGASGAAAFLSGSKVP
jgi:hypothetical protein